MKAITIKRVIDLQVGWRAVFDPLVGLEEVLSITRYKLLKPEPGGANAGSGVEVWHLQVCDGRGEAPVGRFITRAAYETVAVAWPAL